MALPLMRNNPFALRPLTAEDFELLIGRDEITHRAHGWLTARSARMVLLVGERGSGRTSLLNVIGGLASNHHYFSIYPTQDAVRSLLEELYVSVVGDFDVPPTLSLLRNNLVESLNWSSGKLPLLSFDYSNLAGSSIAEMFKQVSQVLRAMDAVSILSLTPSQFNAMPQELIDEFDETLQVTPLSNEETQALVSMRISSVSREAWNAEPALIDELEEQTGGHVSRVMRLMRDVVHSRKQVGGIDARLNDMFLSMKARKEILQADEDSSDEPGLEEPQAEELDDDPADDDEHQEQDEIAGEEEHSLEEHYEDFEPGLTEEESPSEDVSPAQVPVRAGPFGGLGSRTNITNSSMRSEGIAVTPADFHEARIAGVRPVAPPSLGGAVYESEDSALWVDDGVTSPIRIPPSPSPPTPLQPMPRGTDSSALAAQPVEPAQPIQDAYDLIHPPLPPQAAFPTALPEASFSSALQQFNRPGQGAAVDDHALVIDRMRSLEDREVKVLKLLSQRECSPSDPELTELLGGVTRSRLSQICNDLHRAGILSVRKQGRSRVFRISSSARAQLVAWGMLG